MHEVIKQKIFSNSKTITSEFEELLYPFPDVIFI